jgi:putative nucleotidyltransferase with HDIG domain
MKDLRAANRREWQLDAISSLLVVAMLLVVGLLLFLLSSTNGVRLPEWFPLADYVPRLLLGGFVLLVVLYLWDQRRRLREELGLAWQKADEARAELAETCSWLDFSHRAASRLGAVGVEAGMEEVLSEAVDLFAADAAAVLGEDDEHVFVAQDAPILEAERALTHVALTAAGRPTPLHIQSLGTEVGTAIAVPLRVQDDLRYVLCIWRREKEFTPEELDALGLMGRMVELAMEREESLTEARTQLEGTLRVLQYLVADKRPDYSEHAVRVAELAAAVGQTMGLRPQTRQNLRLAGLIHDVGMMSLPARVATAETELTAEERLIVRQHPRIGAEIAKAANFDECVQRAVAGHHERMDSSGYPAGVPARQTTLEARIIAVCEVYDSMTHRTYHGKSSSVEEATRELTTNAGTLYDPQVVSVFLDVVGAPGDVDAAVRRMPLTAEEAVTLAASPAHHA